MVGRWIKRMLVGAVVITGLVLAYREWAGHGEAPSSGSGWFVALALAGFVTGVLTLVLSEGSVPAAIALVTLCVTPGFYPLSAAVLVWGAVDLVRTLRGRRRPA